MANKLLIIDGHSIIHRTFYGLPDLTNHEGLHTNAVYGFIHILLKLLEEEEPDYLAVAFDVHAPTFRHEMYADYKGTRKPMPSELREQVPLMKEVLSAMGVAVIEKAGYEADDVLGTLATHAAGEGMAVTLVSGDRDLLQLSSDKILIRLPKTKGGKTTIEDYTPEAVKEAYGLEPIQIIDLKALMGDSSDNIPGIPGVGEKTATRIIQEYGSVENAYAHVEEIKPKKAMESLRDHYELALFCKKLATIKVDSPIEPDYEAMAHGSLFTKEAYEIFRRLDFKNLLNRFDADNKGGDSLPEITLVDDLSRADCIFANAAKAGQVGVSILAEEGELLGVALSAGEEGNWFFPVRFFLTPEYLGEKLAEVARKAETFASFHLKDLLKFAAVEEAPQVEDVHVAAYLLNPLKSGYSYDDVAGEHLGLTIPPREELFPDKKIKKLAQQREEALAAYAGYEAWVSRKAIPVLKAALEEKKMLKLYREIEMPLVYVLHHMEQEGILVKRRELKEFSQTLGVRIQELEQTIYAQAGEKFNINSPKQLGVILFEKLALKGGKKTKSGYSTAADILEKLAPEAPIVADILEYRQLSKLRSTYAEGLDDYIEEDGKIRSTFHQTITATGRISSADPNLQNIPVRTELGRELRKVFVPGEGNLFIDADYSQIELRVLASMSGDENLIAAYRQDRDIHSVTASQVFHIPLDQVTPEIRRNAKAVNFGIVYGISSFGLSQDLSITRKEAQQYIENYFITYPGIKAFLDKLVADGKEKGYVETYYGRRRPMPELSSGNFMQRSFGERVAMNAPIQGTAADIIKIAMIRVDRRLREEGLQARLILQIHDELLIEAPESEKEAVQALLKQEMEEAAKLPVNLEIDMHTGYSWYEAK